MFTISCIVGCRETLVGASSVLVFFLLTAGEAPFGFSFGSRGFLGFFSLGFPSSIGLPSGSSSFFLRCLFGLFAGAALLAAWAGLGLTSVSLTGAGRCSVSDASAYFGEIGGEDIEDELNSERASSFVAAMIRGMAFIPDVDCLQNFS